MAVDAARAKSLFLAASDLPDRGERAAFLDRECGGNVELRARVDALLLADEGPLGAEPDPTGAFFPGDAGTVDLPSGDSPTGTLNPQVPRPPSIGTGDFGSDNSANTFDGTSPHHRSAIELGAVIAGRYVLVELIGEGGMGSVFLANQSEPVKRQVALKLIKTGMDSKAVLARFDAERQALAVMDHPNIARVYDGGTTERGQPFFVMELVRGVPLTDYCDEKRLSVDARLQLFVSVCQAVQHAHQKGIIHRDLKPANVLVTEVDGRPTPKVIDFGVAKATEMKLTDLSIADTGAIVGTPAYMSPEQADPGSMDIDTRADVYALGVILYELLTGSPPIEARQFKRGAILEMLRMVREVDPPRPSTKLSSTDALPNIAANRSTELAALAKLLRGELDWVVMKALEKDRTRRYDSANGLAQDVQRYLCDEVVEARPPSRRYRLRKLFKRNKVQAIAATLVLFALVAGIVGTTVGLLEARQQADLARGETVEKDKALLAASARLVERDAALAKVKIESDAKDAANDQEKLRVKERDHRIANGTFLLAAAAVDIGNPMLAHQRLDDIEPRHRGWEWHQLLHKSEGGIFTLYGHLGPAGVKRVMYSRDGTRFATLSENNTRVWDARTSELQFVLKGNIGAAFSPDGKRIAIGSAGIVKVWDLTRSTGQQADRTASLHFELKGHTGEVRCVAFSPDGTRILTGDEGSPKVWDAKTGKLQGELKGLRGPVDSLTYSPDGTRILTLSTHIEPLGEGMFGVSSGLINVLDAKTGALLWEPGRSVLDAAFSADGKQIVIAEHGYVTVLDTQTAKPLSKILTGRLPVLSSVNCVAYSPDGTRIATANGDSSSVKVWDAKTGGLQMELHGHRAPVMGVAFSPDGMRLLTGSLDGTAKVWDLSTAPTQWEVDGTAGVFSPDGFHLATAGGNATTIWDVRTGAVVLKLNGGGGPLPEDGVFEDAGLRQNRRGAFSPKATHFVTCENDTTAKVWRLSRTESPQFELKGHSQPVTSVAYNHDGTRIVTGSMDHTAKVWDAGTGKLLLTLTGHAKGVFSVAFSPDDTRIVTASLDKTAKVWDAGTGVLQFELKGHTAQLSSVAYSPDGKRIVTGAWFTMAVHPSGADPDTPGEASVWDAGTGKFLMDLKGLTHGVSSVAFSPTGNRILTGSIDMKVRVWDATTGTPLRELVWAGQDTGELMSGVAFSPNGTCILASFAGVTRVCDARIRVPRVELKADRVLDAAYSPNGLRIVTGMTDHTAKVWDATTGKVLLELKGHADPVQCVAYSPDSTRIVTVGQAFGGSGEIKVWDAATGNVLLEQKGIVRAATKAAFSADGTRIVATLEGGEQVWDATTGQVVEGEVHKMLPDKRFSPDGRLFLHLSRDRVEVIPLKPDQDELGYRKRHLMPNVWGYRQRYFESLYANDDFAARFFFNLIPPTLQEGLPAPPEVAPPEVAPLEVAPPPREK